MSRDAMTDGDLDGAGSPVKIAAELAAAHCRLSAQLQPGQDSAEEGSAVRVPCQGE